MKLQQCSVCGVVKPVSEFYEQSYTGRPSGQCKECTLIKRRAQRQKARTGKFVAKERLRSFEPCEYTNEDWEAAMLHFRGRCCYCGRTEGRARSERFDKEHLIPLSQGGKATRHNIAPACRKCNRGRGNQPLFEWFRAQEFWTAEREKRLVDWMGSEAAAKEGYNDT